MAKCNETLGHMVYDNLINRTDASIVTVMRTVAADSGELERGTMLGKSSETGKLVIFGTEGATAYGILCDDIDAQEDALAEVYIAGHFNKEALKVKQGYTITQNDVDSFREIGIYLDNMMQ